MKPDETAKEKTFDLTYILTDAEIKSLFRLYELKQYLRGGLGKYINLVVITAGIGVSFSGGMIAHHYFRVPLDSNASILVMVLFTCFLAGSVLDRELIRAWMRQLDAPKILRFRETVRVFLDKDGVTYSARGRSSQLAWGTITGVTVSAGLVVLWPGPGQVLAIPLRALSPAEKPEIFVEMVTAWAKAATR